jgi:hypothetical protein
MAFNDNATPLNQLFEGRVMCDGPARIGRLNFRNACKSVPIPYDPADGP